MDHAKALADALRWLLSTISANDEDGLSEFAEPVSAARSALSAYDAHPAEAATRENGDIAAIREHHQVMVEKVEYGYDFGCRLGEFAHRHRGVLLAALSQQGKCFECGSYLQAPICPKCNPEFDISRPHQQQGADREVMKTALCVLRGVENSGDPYLALHPNMRKDVVIAIDGLRDALSRAPQPKCATCKDTQTVWDGEFHIQCPKCHAPQPDTVTDVMDFVDPGPMGEGIFKDKDNLVWYAEPVVRAALTAALAARGKVG